MWKIQSMVYAIRSVSTTSVVLMVHEIGAPRIERIEQKNAVCTFENG